MQIILMNGKIHRARVTKKTSDSIHREITKGMP